MQAQPGDRPLDEHPTSLARPESSSAMLIGDDPIDPTRARPRGDLHTIFHGDERDDAPSRISQARPLRTRRPHQVPRGRRKSTIRPATSSGASSAIRCATPGKRVARASGHHRAPEPTSVGADRSIARRHEVGDEPLPGARVNETGMEKDDRGTGALLDDEQLAAWDRDQPLGSADRRLAHCHRRSYGCSPTRWRPSANRSSEKSEMSAVVVRPSTISSASEAPIAGAVLKPVPLKPQAR